MSQKVIRCPDDKLALLLEHGGLNCTSEAKAVAHGIMLDLRDCRAALAAAEAKLADERRHADALLNALHNPDNITVERAIEAHHARRAAEVK